jgi:hypothetical protein
MPSLQIVGSLRRTDEPTSLRSVSRFGRLKSIVVALLIASAVIGFLLAALVLGSIIALLLLVVVVLALAAAMLRAAIRRVPRMSMTSPVHISRTRSRPDR